MYLYGSSINQDCMSSTKTPQKNSSKKSSTEELSYLEKKFGREPKISPEELAQMRWNWH